MSNSARAWSAALATLLGLAAIAAWAYLTFFDVTADWSLLQVMAVQAAFGAAISIVMAILVILALKPSVDDLYRSRRLLELYHDLTIKIDAVEVAVGHSRSDVTHTMTEVLTTLKEVARHTEPKKAPRKPVEVETNLPQPVTTTSTTVKRPARRRAV
jgi:hypothetical protein